MIARILALAGAVLLGGAAVFFWQASRPPATGDIGNSLANLPLSAPASAQPLAKAPEASAQSREQRRFNRYDKDRDSRITREEYLVSRRKAFAKLDSNGDGRLSFDEWAIRTTTKFAKADADRSGTLDASEFATTAVKRKAPSPPRNCPPAEALKTAGDHTERADDDED